MDPLVPVAHILGQAERLATKLKAAAISDESGLTQEGMPLNCLVFL
jgi:hypothetical protein